ncbi:UNVERIFIED_CONTAM: hypothetical protein NCL1_15383 [Trichonephila clavipes]
MVNFGQPVNDQFVALEHLDDRQEGGRLKTGGLSGLLISLTNLDMSLSMIRCITWIPETTVRSIDRRLRKG